MNKFLVVNAAKLAFGAILAGDFPKPGGNHFRKGFAGLKPSFPNILRQTVESLPPDFRRIQPGWKSTNGKVWE